MSLDTKYIYCPPNVDFSTSYGISEAEISKICAKVDYFNNDKAELQALLKKPISFLIIGKPGTGKSTIARKFSKIWNSFNISCANIVQFSLDLSKDVINDQNNSKKSEMDSSIRDILESGNSITEENAVKLIYQFTNSQICKNSGYIIDEYPSISEEFMSYQSQIDFMKNWKNKPDFIIYLHMRDKDVLKRIIGKRIDIKTSYVYTKSQYTRKNPIKLIKENDEEEQIEEEMEEVEEEFDPELEDNQNKENSAANFKNTDDYRIENPIKGNKIIPHKIIQRLVCPPEFETLHIKRELDNYNNFMLPLIENLIMEYDHEKIIDIDGNKSIDEIIKSISWRLKSLGHYPSPMAKLLSDNGDTDGQESTNELSSIPIGSEEEVEDILRITSCKNTIYPTYRWRRSKWKCVCPVALAEGVFTNGRSELAYSYLDKMYFLSNHERARKFCENPRRYLVPNMPRKPIKMFICGPQLSGKSSLCYILAHFYECTVINMNMEMEEYLKKNEADYLDKSRSESFESAIGEVSTKLNHTLQEIWKGILSEREERENDLEIGLDDEDEEIKIETENKNSHNEIEVDNENGNQFEIKPENENKIEKELEKELEKETEDESIEEKYIISEKVDRLNLTTLELVKSDLEKITNEPQAMEYIVQKCLEIDETHQEVVEIVNKLMIDASRSIPKIAPEIYKNVLEERIKTIEEARRIKLGLDHPYLQGGWIVDNYPISKEYFSVLTDSLVMPDQFIKLFDGSIEFNSILTRWCDVNQDIVKAEYYKNQKRLKKIQIDEIKAKEVELEQKKQDIEIEKENEIVIENEVGKHDANDQVITKDGEVDTSQIAEEEQVVGQVDETPLEKEEKNVSFADEKDELETFSDLSMDNNFIVKFSDVSKLEIIDIQRKIIENYDREFYVAIGNLPLEPTYINVSFDEAKADKPISEEPEKLTKDKNLDDISTEVEKIISDSFKYDAWETQALDIDEDDQDIENERILLESTENINEDSEEEEEELVEESIDPNRSPNKKLGDTNYFCPVRMKNKNVLVPSNSEISARYKEKIYYLSTVEAREAFVKNPNNYISLDKPQKIPAPRIFIIGVKASGKTLHGQEVARRENIFYINFRNVLQNMLFQKTKTFIGPEYFPMDEKTENFSDTDEETNENPVNPENSENVNFANESTEKLRKQSVVYDEDEEAIKAYLESEEPMSNELLDKIILQWWNKEPYRSKGFIMEGFPRTVEEVYYIQDRAIFADVTIIMSCDSTEIVSRLIPKRVEKWIDKKNKKDGKMKIKKEKQRQLRLETIEKRRIELTEKKMEKFKEKSNEETNSNDQNSENEDENRSEEEEESIDEEGERLNIIEAIEEQLREEFDEEIEEDEGEQETEEEARDRFQTDIEEIYENEISRISNVEERLNEIMLPCITIESDRKPHITRYRFNKEIAKYLKNRESFCERVYSITETVANDMLSTGYKFISRFNRWCPVSLSNNDYIQSNNQDENAIAAEYRNYIYFFKSLEKRDIFMTNPLFYVNHIDVTSRPLVPIKLCVIGPPKSGKTTLVKKIVKMYGITKLSMGDVLKKVLNENEESVLNIQLKHILQMGKVVPDILKIAALERVVAEMDCVNKGFVLDDFPNTFNQVRLLTERWIIPGKIFELDLPVEEIIKRATIERYRDDKEHPKHDSANMFAIRLATWNKEISDVRRWYIREHENYVKVDASKSKWFISNTVSLSVNDSIKKIQEYVKGLQNERAAIIDGLCIRPSDFQNQLGGYKNYCPVSFLNDDELVDLQNRKGHELDVEYKGYYYRIENSEKLIKFLNNAEYYIAAFNERSLPISKLLPVVLSDNQKSNTQFNIMFNGYCPVTYVEGDKSYDNIKKGNESILAKYNEKVYSFLNMQTLDKFMRKPHKYSNLELPCKLPPDAVNIKLNKLPMSGYLEQTMADQLICSLSSLAQWKPKRPFLSVKESAIFYLACHMKATNPKSSSYIKHLNMSRIELLKESTIIIDYLAKNMTKKFITQENRPKDFDLNMQVFKGFEQFIRKPLN